MPYPRRRTGLVRLIGAPVMISLLAGCATNRPATDDFMRKAWSHAGFNGEHLTTEHFEIFSTLRDAEFESALPGFLEALHQRYADTIPPNADTMGKLRLYIFGTRSEWSRFTRREFPDRFATYSKIRSGGFTEGDTSVSFYVNRSDTLATLAHEGWHLYLGAHCDGPIPAWLNEGLACYHEAVRFSGVKPAFTPRHNTFRVNSLRRAIQSDALMPLSELIRTDAVAVIEGNNHGTTQTYYSQAWALVTFLRHGASGRYAPAFDELMRDISAGTLNVRLGAARLRNLGTAELCLGEAVIRHYFGTSTESLANEYYDHLIRIVGY